MDNWKVFCSDVDDTLAMHNLSEYPTEQRVVVEYTHGPMVIVPNQKNINTLIKFKKLGYYVIVWSRTGSDWAEKVCEATGIDGYVDLYLTKPIFILDDRPANEWTERIWRDAK